jgi:hypothetical protein
MKKIHKFTLAIAMALTAGLLAPLSATAAPIDETSGYDVSWPQCGEVLPTDGAFNIIGVNGGKAFQDNPCFDEQLIWAGGEKAELYLNTGNPGSLLSSFWPIGQTTPKVCLAEDPDSYRCSYNYGYNFANYSYLFASLAYLRSGLTTTPADTRIWLDVETINSWNLTDTKKNIGALRGAVYYLEKVQKVSRIGFYSVASHWEEITGNTQVFSDYPTWVATGSDAVQSVEKCSEKISFTGGKIRFAQYIDSDLDLDVNVDCLNPTKVVTSIEKPSPASGTPGEYVKLRGKLVSSSGNPVKNVLVTIKYRGNSYKVRTNANGVAKKYVRLPVSSGDYSFRFIFAGNRFFEAKKAVQELTVR